MNIRLLGKSLLNVPHPLNRIQGENGFAFNCSLIAEAATFEMCAAKEMSATSDTSDYDTLRQSAHRARRIYDEAHEEARQLADKITAQKLRGEGLAEFADALESGSFDELLF